jgi:hypothetical protein
MKRPSEALSNNRLQQLGNQRGLAPVIGARDNIEPLGGAILKGEG